MKLKIKITQLKKMKMSNQILFIMIIVALIPLLILSISINNKIKKQSTIELDKRLDQDIIYIEESLKSTIMNSVETIKLIKSQSQIEKIFEDISSGQLQKYSTEYNNIIKVFENIVTDSERLYERVLIADQYGNMINDISREEGSFNLLSIAGKDYYNGLKENDKDYYIGRTIISTATKRQITPISMKISKDNNILGAIVIFFDTEELTGLLQKINNGQGTALLLDERGNYLYNFNSSLTLSKWEDYKELEYDKIITYRQDDTYYYGKGKIIQDLNWTIIPLINEEEAYGMINRINNNLIWITLILLIGIIIISTVYAKLITKPISYLAYQMSDVMNGNLEQKVIYDTNKEITILNDNFTKMIIYLKEIIQSITMASKTLYNSSIAMIKDTDQAYNYTKTTNQSLSTIGEDALKQQESIQHGLEVLKSLVNEINRITSSTKEMRKTFEISKNITSQGNESICTLRAKSRSSLKISKELQQEMNILIDSVTEIQNISNVITDISKQTDLLALNATIEAARAGEYGKSFGIVANEVKRLSEIINNETKNINNIINELKMKSEVLRNYIINNEQIIESQNEAVKNTENSLNDIIDYNESMIVKTKDIIDSMYEVSTNNEYIHGFTVNISNNLKETVDRTSSVIAAAQNQFAVIEELKDASITLQKQSYSLVEAVKDFSEADKPNV
ncbi:methyl-accepting chemotaxis protein [Vallitalea guaymasensis]|uniref:methyl-accepting chemotaxis protein n=1 Tax=Vallitalea guaymasensis TaxID=1185412 RepID=UPI000DE1D479|nr:methyl-accepting chemotaxis protein [Vallitalea guaymasensis]